MQIPPPPSPNPNAAPPNQSFTIGILLAEGWSCGPLSTNAWLLSDSGARQMLLIDPAIQSQAALARARHLGGQGFEMIAIWNTHGHFDHVYDNALWKSAFEAPLALHSDDAFFLEHLREQSLWFGLPAPEEVAPNQDWKGTESAQFSGRQVQVLHTPGHSPGSVSFYFEAENLLICGDVLFQNSVGRTDLPQSSAQDLKSSLQVLVALPPETLVLPGHGPATTIGEELQHNPILKELGVSG